MIINNDPNNGNRASQSTLKNKVETVANTGTAANTVTDEGSHGDTVNLSPEALSVKRLEAKIEESSGVNSARVEYIKQLINDGQYVINSNRIAEKLLQHEDLF